MPTITDREHLNWCTTRALEYFDINDKNAAFASFLSDVGKEPGTAWIAGHPATFMLMEMGWMGGRHEFKKALEGFAASDTPHNITNEHRPIAPANTGGHDGMAQVLYGGMAGRLDGGSTNFGSQVLVQEAAGQQSLINSSTLPAKVSDQGRKILERAGVVFGQLVLDDDLFVFVTLPEGWRKEGTDHNMWSKLLDGQGRERAAIFYKAAFYDRRAHMSVEPRFEIREDYNDQNMIVFSVRDGGEVAFTGMSVPRKGISQRRYRKQMKQARRQVNGWLNQNHPGWETASAWV